MWFSLSIKLQDIYSYNSVKVWEYIQFPPPLKLIDTKKTKYNKMSMKVAPKTNRPLSKNDFLGCFLKRRKLTTDIYNLDIHA